MPEIEGPIPGSAGAQPDHPLSVSVNKAPAKRVILRLKVNEFSEGDPSEYNDAIKTYLAFDGHPELRQTRFHITLDMEQDSTENPDFGKLPHEIYRIRRDGQGKFQVTQIQNALERENLIRKIRQYSDFLYPWGRTKRAKTSKASDAMLA
ncbi:hypothetical protein CC80DRAFT_555015 [Byssothecium circinans]|uniref:Uncharacterized protein n=1 Tax=Byssothecium circinans TaxID=147558 RepID=A0A6A5TBY5_9PLEO|nr:hypothetical protein CC80DRAFT_555015 [Byssothecium circinans]